MHAIGARERMRGLCDGRADHTRYAFRTDRPHLRIGASIRSGRTGSFKEQKGPLMSELTPLTKAAGPDLAFSTMAA